MTDLRKPTIRPSGAEAERVRHIINRHLIACTNSAARDLKCTGVSVVTMGIGIWADELAQLHPEAASNLMKALADMLHPKSTDASRAEAENRRAYAVSRLHQALDVMMASSQGRA